MNIGDRINFKDHSNYYHHCGEIVEVSQSAIDNWKPRYLVNVFKTLNIHGNNIRTWVRVDEIEIDKEWFRNKNLEDLGC